ncbi:MAG: InlB B-repeat-containing protein [Clostridia bacterium]|nr:InlB B-repeat-containing protein [Clostridia bacterium]
MKKIGKRILSTILAVATLMSCWVWMAPEQNKAAAATTDAKDHYLFAYFTGTSKEGQTIHLAVSEDGYNYTALRANEPVIIPSKGVGNVRDPYIWYNEQDNYYYILATDLDFTDGGGTYSNNSQSFIIWRSKDLVHWYDETFIDVSKMAHLIGDTRNMSAVWAPQVLWDGSAYVVYFTLACNATSWFDIVYLKTTDLLDPNAYYEFDYILGNGTGNGTDNGYGVIDADIIHNPGDGKYYLFYKTECNANELGTTNKGTSLKTIHYYVGDTPTGPFKNPGDTKWSNCGFSVFPDYNVSLEGCNSFFDNEGNLIMYVDEFEHTNYYTGKEEAYFHIAKSNGYDFTSWTYPDVSQHNINSLSPRHGSVVKITTEEYNRLRKNSYLISSSSYPATEVLEDHLVAQYFTTDDVLWNNVIGQPNLASSTGITMVNDPSIGYYASFDSTNGGWAEVDFDSLFRKTNGLNYEDGFTITFNAMLQPNASTNNENNDRIYEIADVFGSRTGTEHYTHFSPGGGGNGSYLGNYNGPVDSGNDWLNDKDGANRDDEKFHEYIISYATGNVLVYVDGELVISRNRFTGVKLDDSWYKALGSNATMRIGKSGWEADDPLFKGRIQNLCIYDCSMSYYDAQSMYDSYKEDLGWVDEGNYTGITSAVPTFANSNASQMESRRGINFSNILYTAPVTGTPSGTYESANPTHGDVIGSAATYMEKNEMKMGVYYSPLTVVLLDGKNQALIPVEIAGRSNSKDSDDYFYQAYPSNYTTTADNPEVKLVDKWIGWNQKDQYADTIAMTNPDGYFGHNAATSIQSPKLDHSKDWAGVEYQSTRKVCFYAGTMYIDENNIDFGNSYYKKINLFWRIVGNNDGTPFSDVAFSDHDIYLIDFRPVLELREEITEDAYNAVMNDSRLCPALREKYAAAVYSIRTLDPNNFGFDTAPVTATNALGKAIREAVNTYNGVMKEIEREKAAGFYGHQCSDFAAREATCAVNGLTEGSYCAICGEIVKEQEVIAPLPHSFGDIYTENGIQYRKCSVCGVKIEYQASGVRYENLFSLNGWMDSLSYNNGSGVSGGATLSANSADGQITINNSNTGEAVTSTSGSSNRDGTWNCYCIPVKGNKTYVVEFTVSGVQGEIHIFKYDINGNLTGSYGDTPVAGTNGTFSKEFTVDATTAYIELRFDCNAKGTATFSQIGVYTKESFDTFAKTTAEARLGYYPGDSKDLVHPNPGDGYSFDGWYTKSGIRIENVNQLNNPTVIVYGKWIPAGYNVVYDSIFSFSSWAKSSCNQLWYGDTYALNADGSRGSFTGPRLVSHEGIVADAENGTIKITWDADNKNYADTENGKYIQYCARTNLHKDASNLYNMDVEPNTDYIIEYTASSTDGAKPNVCAYMPSAGNDANGNSMAAQESGLTTRYGLGTQYFKINTYASTKLILRFDNVQIGSTVTYSNIAVYKADTFQDHAKHITNREFMRYYPQKMGIGDVFEYIPTRPGYTFDTWEADLDTPIDKGTFNLKGFDDSFLVEQNWHIFSKWTENSYTVTFNANGGTSTIPDQTIKYTQDITMPSSGVTKKGYTLKGWSTVKNATSALYQAGQEGVNRLNGDKDGTITLYAVWWNNVYNMTFDNLIDFDAWNKTSSKGVVSDITETGFTLTSNDGVGEATSTSPFFAVEPGKQYKIDIDITGTNWDVYIFFCNANGAWVNFADSTNRYSSNGSGVSSRIFTAPTDDTVVKAQIRVDANGSNNAVTFDNIRVYEYKLNEINYSDNIYRYQEATYDEAYPETAMTPTRVGYDFKGWYNGAKQYYQYDKNENITNRLANLGEFKSAETFKLFSQWQLNGNSLTPDSYVADFDATIKVDPIKNDQIFLNEAINSNNSSYTVSVETAGASASSNIVSYKPSSIFNEITKIPYFAQLAQGDYSANKVSNTISVIPASNVFYEEDVLTAGDTGKAQWGIYGTAGNTAQTDNSVYGYDALYDNANDYSNGSAKMTTVSSSNNRSETLNFTFTGTGFELYGACGNNTGVQVIAVRDLDNWTDKTKPAPLVKSAVVDTYYNDSYGTLYQTPIYNVSGLGYGTYTVEVTAAYLSMAGALKAQSAEVFGTLSTNDNELADALAEVGLDYILEADDVDVEWFDDESILNGGTGANDPEAFGTYAVDKPLVNYVDAVRVFEPLEEADENTHYIDSEQNARYYNINDNLMSASNFITGGSGFVYVEGQEADDRFEIGAADYNKKGSKHEIYLANGNSQALTFTVANVGDYSRVMLSLRSATGGDITVKIGGNDLTVSSKTDMYYDITDCVQNGTVTIENATANSLLAIGYLKLTGDATFETTSDLSSAIEMIETPLDGEEITTGAITNVEYTPSTDSHNTFNVTVNGRPTMIQFIEEDGGTRTYDRNNKNVTIKSYNADGVEVNSLDRTVAYEVWTINTNLTGPEVKARAKFITDGAYKWDKNPYSFTYEILEPVLDAGLRSITPAAESGKKGAVEVKVVTGPDAQGVRFVMPDGSTCTYNATKAVTLENGDLEFTGKAWMNEDGLNTISVYIRENNVWNSVGTIEYTAE